MNNDVFPNKFKAALAAKQVQIGCWSALSNPISTEVLGLAGFDWLVLDGEHAKIVWEEWGKASTSTGGNIGGDDSGNPGGNDGDQGENPLG